MKALLLTLHVVAAIVLIGPITVAASVFPRYARAAAQRGGPGDGTAPRAVAAAMHRISRGYAIPALAVPVFGIGTGAALGVLGQAWVITAMALTALAGMLLAAVIVPGQRRVLAALAAGAAADRDGATNDPATGLGSRDRALAKLPRLAMITGSFAMIWVIVVVLMILRPGSTTGV